MHHFLKIWPQYFYHVKRGTKTFEIRNNDRGFQQGDTVTLREWNPEATSNRQISNPLMMMIGQQKTAYEKGDYTESEPITFKIGYVFPLDDNRVVFSLLEPKE